MKKRTLGGTHNRALFALIALLGLLVVAPFAFARITNPGGSGSGVTSVSGTSNQITSSGGTTPTLSLPSLVIFPTAASTTRLSVFDIAYFGGSATSSFASNGALTLASALTVANGGTGATSFPSNTLMWYDGSTFAATGTPQLTIGYLLATSTTATSTFNGGVNFKGTIQLAAQQPATTTTLVLDWANTPPLIEYQIGTSATTLYLTNATTSTQWGSRKLVTVCNPGGTAGALTVTGVEWIGTAPTQTTTASQCDVYSFFVTRATSTSAYKVAGTMGAGLQ